MRRQGFFTIQTPADLVAKCEHDLARIRERPGDPYPAFDFFIAARHVPDWIATADVDRRVENILDDRCRKEIAELAESIFNAHPRLKIARHLADRSKHLVVTREGRKSNRTPFHKEVEGTTMPPWSEPSWLLRRLEIAIDVNDQDARSYYPDGRVEVVALAADILEDLRRALKSSARV